jgi:hypothetical protein
MERFANIELKLKKSVMKGDKSTLLRLFSAAERFKHMEVLADAEEGTNLKVILEGLGEVVMQLGDDMEKGQRKTIMTLFWFSEKSKPIEMLRNAEAGENITVNIWKN